MINLKDFIIPAIDIKEGKIVRLTSGNFSKVKEYGKHPAEMAQYFEQKGFKRLHIVDLDAAKEGKPKNTKSILEIRNKFSGTIELGGGLRDLETLRIYKEEGVDYFVIGTLALKKRKLFEEMIYMFPETIILAIDSKKGKVAISGWTSISEMKPEDLVRKYNNMPVWGYLYTIVERDGMLKGVDIEPYISIKGITKKPVIASGGVSSLEDIKKLYGVVDFVIVGKAIYEGLIQF